MVKWGGGEGDKGRGEKKIQNKRVGIGATPVVQGTGWHLGVYQRLLLHFSRPSFPQSATFFYGSTMYGRPMSCRCGGGGGGGREDLGKRR